ncbi:MAG TPA: hypothetical protein VMR62_20275 [Bryobacteraceae bacterium]|nr:hypothetical protein [Bryobacteraceae bacterium]
MSNVLNEEKKQQVIDLGGWAGRCGGSFRYYHYGGRTVHLDGCAEVEAAYYGAPPGWIGRRIWVQ